MRQFKYLGRSFTLFTIISMIAVTLTGCGNKINESGVDIYTSWDQNSEFIREAEKTGYVYSDYIETNSEYSLSVPTYIDKIDDYWFIVDCYHNQIIYNDNLDDSLTEWKVLTKDVSMPHTMASDGEVILVDDTENNRVLVFEKNGDTYANTQVFNEIGTRPHYTVYDEEDKAFYVWSSITGEMYVFRRHSGDRTMYLTEIRSVDELSGTYIRSFYLDGNDIYFVSGITPEGKASDIIKCNKRTFEIENRYSVPDKLAGMAAMGYCNGYYFITVSTDVTGNQDAATMLRVKRLEDLEKGNYEEIYDKYFVGGGTPYNFFMGDDRWYLTEHRLPGHSIWSYSITADGDIDDVQAVY